MKKTQFIELLKNIKSTLVSFISISMFVALGVCVYVGLSWVSRGIIDKLDETLESAKYYDVEVLFPYGMNEEDFETLLSVDGVDEVEGSYTGYAFMNIKDVKYQIKLVQVRENVSVPLSIDGRVPKEYNEIAIDKLFAKEHNIKIGDTITFNEDNDGSSRTLIRIVQYDSDYSDLDSLTSEDEHLMAYLKTNEFKVTGLATNAEYLSVNKNSYGVATSNGLPIDCFAYLMEDAFDEESFLGYPDVFIRSDSLRKYSSFSDEYKKELDLLKETIIEEATDDIAYNKCEYIRNSINSVKEGAQNKLDNAHKQIISSNNQIINAKKQLESGKDQLDDGKKQLGNAESQITRLQNEFNNLKNDFNNLVSVYNNLKNGISTVSDYIELTPEEVVNTLTIIRRAANTLGFYELGDSLQIAINYINEGSYSDAAEIVMSCFSDIDAMIAKYQGMVNDSSNQIEASRDLLSMGWDSYNMMEDEYNSKVRQVESAERSLSNAKSQYNEGIRLLDEFNEKINDIPTYECTLLSRNFNTGIIIGLTISNMMSNLKYSMAMLFVVVGLLVCYSSLSRIVNDQISAIGTKKALGLSTKEITIAYLTYTAIAVIIGCILGCILGVAIVETIMKGVINSTFNFKYEYVVYIEDILPICTIELFSLLIVSFVACNKVLRRDAVKLLAGQTQISGKVRFYENFKIWKKLSLFSKTIINNCFNEKRRVLGTIIGIAGSTALIVTALTMRNNILESFDIQYSKYFHFDTVINYDSENEEASKNIRAYLEEHNIPCADIYYSRFFTLTPDNLYITSHIFVPDDYREFDKLVSIETDNKINKNSINEGFWMAASFKNYYEYPEDEPLDLVLLSGKQASITPSGYFPFYLSNYQTIMDKKTYFENFKIEANHNAFIINANAVNKNKMIEELKQIDGYINTMNYYDISKASFDEFNKVSFSMVVIYFVLAIIMALLVSLNLLNMFIEEKKRELIVLMINGYSLASAKKYIYSDTIFLTFISVFIGIALGSYVGDASVKGLESIATSFVHKVNVEACLCGIGGCFVLTIIVSIIALSKIKRFKLTDINKY